MNTIVGCNPLIKTELGMEFEGDSEGEREDCAPWRKVGRPSVMCSQRPQHQPQGRGDQAPPMNLGSLVTMVAKIIKLLKEEKKSLWYRGCSTAFREGGSKTCSLALHHDHWCF